MTIPFIFEQEIRDAVRDLGSGPVEGFEVRWLIADVTTDVKSAPQRATEWFFVPRAQMDRMLVQWSQYARGYATGHNSTAGAASRKSSRH